MALLLWTPPAACIAQESVSERAALCGIVRDSFSLLPLEGAQLILSGTGITALTDTRGAYRLSDIPLGSHTVVVRRLGYVSKEVPNVTVQPGEESRLDILLLPADSASPGCLDSVEADRRKRRLSLQMYEEEVATVLETLDGTGRSPAPPPANEEVRVWEAWGIALVHQLIRIRRVGDKYTGEYVQWWTSDYEPSRTLWQSYESENLCDERWMAAGRYWCRTRFAPLTASALFTRFLESGLSNIPPIDSLPLPEGARCTGSGITIVIDDAEHMLVEYLSSDRRVMYGDHLGPWETAARFPEARVLLDSLWLVHRPSR